MLRLFCRAALPTVILVLLMANTAAAVNVSVSSPTANANVSSPVTVRASASGSSQITGWYVYVDDVAAWHTSGPTSSIAPQVSMGGGWHTIHVRAWQSTGAYGDNYFRVNVTGTSSPNPGSGLPTPPSSAKVWSHLEDGTSAWSSCSANCAGGKSTSNFWTAPYQSSPSLDGSSREFFNGGGAWANTLWTKKLGAQDWATHFIWDFWVYFDSNAAHNLWTAEYDLFQAVNHREFMIGSQCNFGAGRWDTWNAATNNWIHTSVPCPRFAPNTWHHIQWYVTTNTSTHTYKYVTLVVDGHSYPGSLARPRKRRPAMTRVALPLRAPRCCETASLFPE